MRLNHRELLPEVLREALREVLREGVFGSIDR
jgi:hypothetical protein